MQNVPILLESTSEDGICEEPAADLYPEILVTSD